MATIHRNSKPDTVLLLDFAAGNDQVDYSQYRTNITNNTTYLSEANSARTAIDAPREIGIVVELTNTDTGVLIDHGNGATYAYRIDVTAGGLVRCRINGTTVLSTTAPSVGATETKYAIQWCMRDLGGGSYFSVLTVMTTGGATPSVVNATHSNVAADSTHTLTVGAANGGASTFSGGLADIYYVRIGRRFHSATECGEDWRSESSPSAVTGTRREPALVPDRSTLTALSEEDNFVGPGHLASGYAIQQSDRRLTGPLATGPIQTLSSANAVITNTFDEGSEGWWKLAPNDEVIYIGLPLLWYVPVPTHCNRLRVRLGVQQNNLVGSSAVIHYRAYSMAGLPVVGEGIGPFKYFRSSDVTNTVEQPSAGATTILDLGSMGIAVDDWGCTWLAVGVGYEPGDPNAADTTVSILHTMFDPYYEPAADQAYDFAIQE